jgi:hypothetical protein
MYRNVGKYQSVSGQSIGPIFKVQAVPLVAGTDSMSRNVGDYQSVSEQPIDPIFKSQAVLLKKRPTRCFETSENNYQPTLRCTPEERRSEITRHPFESPILYLCVRSSTRDSERPCPVTRTAQPASNSTPPATMYQSTPRHGQE